MLIAKKTRGTELREKKIAFKHIWGGLRPLVGRKDGWDVGGLGTVDDSPQGGWARLSGVVARGRDGPGPGSHCLAALPRSSSLELVGRPVLEGVAGQPL